MKIKNIILVVLVILVIVLSIYSFVLQNELYKMRTKNLILDNSIQRMEKEIIELKKSH